LVPKSGERELRLDREVLALLRHDPELLAIADAIASTQLHDTGNQPDAPRRRWLGLSNLGHALMATARRRLRG
jgi:hypothetical protein